MYLHSSEIPSPSKRWGFQACVLKSLGVIWSAFTSTPMSSQVSSHGTTLEILPFPTATATATTTTTTTTTNSKSEKVQILCQCVLRNCIWKRERLILVFSTREEQIDLLFEVHIPTRSKLMANLLHPTGNGETKGKRRQKLVQKSLACLLLYLRSLP